MSILIAVNWFYYIFVFPFVLKDYQHDKYSDSDPCNTICCRGDLKPDVKQPFGCYDTKVFVIVRSLTRIRHLYVPIEVV